MGKEGRKTTKTIEARHRGFCFWIAVEWRSSPAKQFKQAARRSVDNLGLGVNEATWD